MPKLIRRKKLAVGDTVHLRKDVLRRFSHSVPAHMGYTTAQFAWQDTLRKHQYQIGTVTRTFPSGHVNVTFRDGTTIGIDSGELAINKRKVS